MVCQKCGKKEYLFKGEPYCPCEEEGVVVLSKEHSKEIIEDQISKMDKVLTDRLKEFEKKRLLIWIIDRREQFSAPFFENKPSIELDQFLSMSYLIKKVMEIPEEEMGELEADKENTKELINIFSFFLEYLQRQYYIEEDFAIYCERKDEKNPLLKYFPIFDDSWNCILESYMNNLIMTKSQGEEYLEKHKKEYEEVFSSPIEPEELSTEETMRRLFPALMTFRVALQKNKAYGEIFNLDHLKAFGISPDKLLSIIKNEFKDHQNLIHQSNQQSILSVIKRYFPRTRERLIYKKLVFSEANPSVFPLFIEVDGRVYTSRSFIKLMCVFYYSLFYKDQFNKCLKENGKKFEDKEIPDKFKEIEFNYISDITDKPKNPTLQIDGISWKDKTLYVIEAKVWDIKPFFEHRNIHVDRERDLKGVVDGVEYTTKIENDEKIVTEKPRPSLIKKINYIKENIEAYCGKDHNISNIKSMVITKSVPIIKEYNGVDFIGYSEIEKLK